MKKYLLLFALMLYVCFAFSQNGKKKSTRAAFSVYIIFQNMVGDSILQTGSTYINSLGEPFIIRAFKYYVSDIQLLYADGSTYNIAKPPHLVNEIDTSTRLLSITAPTGTITGIQFLLGVDSVINTTGVQTGDLDPANGMYWVWNTGYIMAKLEGSSPVAKSPGHQFSYDIGGYKWGENAARKITLTSSSTANYPTSLVLIKADVLKWFNSAHDIKIAAQPMCHEPGKLAMQIADNYEKMFSVHFE